MHHRVTMPGVPLVLRGTRAIGAALALQCAIAWAESPPVTVGAAAPAELLPQGASQARGGAGVVESIEANARADGADGKGEAMVVPLPFENPLIGTGLVVVAGYLYHSETGAGVETPPSIVGAGVMYAEEGTWAAALGHRGYWDAGQWRTSLAGVTGEIHYDLTVGDGDLEREIGVSQTLQGVMLEAAHRVLTHGWLGGSFVYGTTDVSAPTFQVEDDIVLSDIGVSAEWDTRDDTFAPRAGTFSSLEVQRFDEAIASDYGFTRFDAAVNGYHAVAERHVLAWRIAGQHVEGDAPFFALPWLGTGCDLRGYSPGEYVGRTLVAGQAEWRLQLTPRWGVVAFGGVATVRNAPTDFKSSDALPAGGVGLRFRVTDQFRVNVRADVAWGRDDSTFTLTVGEAF
jgi:hypothetical protein